MKPSMKDEMETEERKNGNEKTYQTYHHRIGNHTLSCITRVEETAAIGTETVSYTHLDVYKRQVLAQLGEHLPCTQGVIGSIPIRSTMIAYSELYLLRFGFFYESRCTCFVKVPAMLCVIRILYNEYCRGKT